MNVIQIVLLLMGISCMPGRSHTLVSDICYDTHGNPIHLGVVYYDGVSWRTCWTKDKDDQRQKFEFMEHKWRQLFLIFDSNNDGLITIEDIDISKERYVVVYEPYGVDVDDIKTELDKFWHCLLLDTYRFRPKITEAKFIASYRNAFQNHKASAARRTERCNKYMAKIDDINKDGYISFGELLEDYKAWNLGNKKLVQELFSRMEPNDDNLVSAENFFKFYAETWFSNFKV